MDMRELRNLHDYNYNILQVRLSNQVAKCFKLQLAQTYLPWCLPQRSYQAQVFCTNGQRGRRNWVAKHIKSWAWSDDTVASAGQQESPGKSPLVGLVGRKTMSLPMATQCNTCNRARLLQVPALEKHGKTRSRGSCQDFSARIENLCHGPWKSWISWCFMFLWVRSWA